VRFAFTQHFSAPPDAVAAAYTEPELYDALDSLPKLGAPEVLSRSVDGECVDLNIRYRFKGDLNAAVRAAIDPAKLSWIEESHHDLDALRVTFVMRPDHYADRFKGSGSYRFEADGDGTIRRSEGELSVKAALVGRRVEQAIISGLGEHLADETKVVDRWLADRAG
jgi:hypothetical protein